MSSGKSDQMKGRVKEAAGVLSGDKKSLYDMLAKVGARTAESQVVVGEQPGTGGFKMSPQAASAKISELLADKSFSEQYFNTNPKIRAPAIARIEELQKIANP